MIGRICFLLSLALLLAPAAGVYSQESDSGRSYYDLGVFAYEEGNYEDAETQLRNALALNPKSALYHHYLGKTHMKMERYDEAMVHLDLAWGQDPDTFGLKKDLADVNYRLQRYSVSARLFEEIAENDPSDALAHYHAGISLYEQEQYQRALDHFTIASDISPTIKPNGYYYAGVCHLKKGNYDAAIVKLQYVRDFGDTLSLKQNAVKLLDAINQRKKAAKPYHVYAKIGYRYDSNVRLEPNDDDTVSDEDDWVLVGYFTGRYDLLSQKPYTAGIGYRHYQTLYDDLDQYDLTGSVLRFYGKYDLGPLGLSLSYLPHFYWLDSDRYIRKDQAQAEATYHIAKDIVARLSYSYSRNTHFQDWSWGGYTNELSFKTYYSLKDKGYLYGGIDFEDRTTNGLDHCYNGFELNAGVSLDLPWAVTLRTAGKISDIHHDNVDSVYLYERKDMKYSGSISVSKALSYDWLSVTLEFDYTSRGSNIDEYEYVRKRTTLSLTSRF
jgi:Flp pilus assembly protein TadD